MPYLVRGVEVTDLKHFGGEGNAILGSKKLSSPSLSLTTSFSIFNILKLSIVTRVAHYTFVITILVFSYLVFTIKQSSRHVINCI